MQFCTNCKETTPGIKFCTTCGNRIQNNKNNEFEVRNNFVSYFNDKKIRIIILVTLIIFIAFIFIRSVLIDSANKAQEQSNLNQDLLLKYNECFKIENGLLYGSEWTDFPIWLENISKKNFNESRLTDREKFQFLRLKKVCSPILD